MASVVNGQGGQWANHLLVLAGLSSVRLMTAPARRARRAWVSKPGTLSFVWPRTVEIKWADGLGERNLGDFVIGICTPYEWS